MKLPVGGERRLTEGEIALARSVFGDAIDYGKVTIRRRKFFPLQPRQTTMAPRGHLYFHPLGDVYSDDFSAEPVLKAGLFIHELTHVWQTQRRGEWYLLLHRHPLLEHRGRTGRFGEEIEQLGRVDVQVGAQRKLFTQRLPIDHQR